MVDGKKIDIMVSVIMVTYGHEKYICEAIDGVLIQSCDFDVELIIANDCSPDRTDNVVKEYLSEVKIPSNIKIHYTQHEVNKGANENFMWAVGQASGKYIAICEGDDYWTDPFKLKKQVGFLESNPSFGMVCTDFLVKKVDEVYENIFTLKNDTELKLENLLSHNSIGTLTVMLRRNLLKNIDYNNLSIDFALWLEIISISKVQYLKETTAVYNVLQNSASGRGNINKETQFYCQIFNAAKNNYIKNKFDTDLLLKRFLPYSRNLVSQYKFLLFFKEWLAFIRISKPKYILYMFKQLVR